MTQLLSRILLTILLFPLAAMVYITFLVLVVYYRPDEIMFIYATIITWLFVAWYWLRLWRKSVRWNAKRIYGTIVSASIASAVGLGIYFVFLIVRHQISELGVFVGGIMAILLWLVFTVLLWRETNDERVARIRQAGGDALFCAQCGYNMTGLKESRCPECGQAYTLDALFAAQKTETIEQDSDS